MLAGAAALVAAGCGQMGGGKASEAGSVAVLVDGRPRACAAVAATAEAQQKGLRGSTAPALVFRWTEPTTPAFWNRGVTRDLRLVWVGDAGKVVAVSNLAAGSSELVGPPAPVVLAVEFAPDVWGQGGSKVGVGGPCVGAP